MGFVQTDELKEEEEKGVNCDAWFGCLGWFGAGFVWVGLDYAWVCLGWFGLVGIFGLVLGWVDLDWVWWAPH